MPARASVAQQIVRTWICWVRTEHVAFCRAHVETRQLAAMRAADGNVEAITHCRDMGDGMTEVAFLSLWESMDPVRRFVGEEVSAPFWKISPREERMTLDREPVVRMHAVPAGQQGKLLDWC